MVFPVGRQTDQTTMAQAFAGPGMDPRVWIAYAVVDEAGEAEGEQAVEFDKDDGQVYVNVLLKPYDTPLRCRVGQLFAGPGEACFFPVMPGDEVLVAIPEGHYRAGAVVIARLNNAYDAFPFDSVAGADPTKNSFAVFRTRTALTFESGASIMLRSAAAGAFVQLSGQGSITLRDAAKNVLQMSPDVYGFQNGDGDTVMQLDLNAKRFNLAIGNAQLTLSGDGGGSNPQSVLQVPSTFAVTAAGQSIISAVEHVVTTEALFNILANALPLVLAAATPSVAFIPPPPAPASPLYAALAGAIAAAMASPQHPAVAAALFGAFSAPMLKPPGVPGQGQLAPGIGAAGFLTG